MHYQSLPYSVFHYLFFCRPPSQSKSAEPPASPARSRSRSHSVQSSGSSSASSTRRRSRSSSRRKRSKSGSSSRSSSKSRSSEDKENQESKTQDNQVSNTEDINDDDEKDKLFPEKDKKNKDMFSDMFGDNFAVDKLGDIHSGAAENPNLTDNWDDAEGYYRVRIGETLDTRLVIKL